MTKPADPAYHWNATALDVDAYFARIGFAGAPEPTLETLRGLQHAHTTTIPFENLDIILGRAIVLELDAVQDKLVRRRRGGYCYEHVVLFAAALERLGFGVTGLHARVVMGARSGLHPATHAVLRVTTADDDRVWLCDVGFGSGPSAPLLLDAAVGEVSTGEWRFRLACDRDELGGPQWTLHHFARDGWIARHTFTPNPQYRIDYAVGSHFVSTSPRSPFVTRPYVQRFVPRAHHVLDGSSLLTEYPDGGSDARDVPAAELPTVLSEVFALELDEADLAALAEQPWLYH